MGHPKSFQPRHIRQQYFPQFIHQWNEHPLGTLMSQLQIWRHCNLWRHRALNRNNFQRPRTRLESFIIMYSGNHHCQILDFKTDNSHCCCHCCMHGGLGVESHSHKQPGSCRLWTGPQCWNLGKLCWACSRASPSPPCPSWAHVTSHKFRLAFH